MPASTQPTCSNVAVLGRGRLDEHVAGAEVRVVHELRHRRDLRHTRVGRTELRDPLVARLGRDRGAEVGADRVLHRVVGLVREPLLAAERAAQVRVEVRLDRADRDPAVVARSGRRRNTRSDR